MSRLWEKLFPCFRGEPADEEKQEEKSVGEKKKANSQKTNASKARVQGLAEHRSASSGRHKEVKKERRIDSTKGSGSQNPVKTLSCVPSDAKAAKMKEKKPLKAEAAVGKEKDQEGNGQKVDDSKFADEKRAMKKYRSKCRKAAQEAFDRCEEKGGNKNTDRGVRATQKEYKAVIIKYFEDFSKKKVDLRHLRTQHVNDVMLKTVGKLKKGDRIKIVTGWGKDSPDGGTPNRDRVEDYLKRKGLRFKRIPESKEGAIKVWL